MREVKVLSAWGPRLCKPNPCLSILPGCMAGRMEWSSPAVRLKERRQEARVDEVLVVLSVLTSSFCLCAALSSLSMGGHAGNSRSSSKAG